MAVADVLGFLEHNPVMHKRIVHIEITGPVSPMYGTLNAPLNGALEAFLEQRGIQLYTHQCEAINHIREGKNVILTTPTASGKTLAFNIPVFEGIEADPQVRALYLYPTKALANDQLATLIQMANFTGIPASPAIYDGDTPKSKRPAIRLNARIIVSNPYEIHQVLAWHAKWHEFLSNLRFVVIDEAHRYRGVFGSHIALLIRRLLRLCRHYASDPQIILSTATLANPLEFAGQLTGRSFELVDRDASPHGKNHFVLYNPYYDGIGERSIHEETKDLLGTCIKGNLQTLCFTSSRKMAELVSVWARDDARRFSIRLANAIATYRAGYLPEERRAIERQLKDGSMKGVVSTNALELGIDIGSLDAVIISGYPGTMMAARQQAGRAGRKGDPSLAILVAHANPLDQYFMHHPVQFFSRSHEHAIIDIHNPYIVSGHMLCAAAELPLQEPIDGQFFGDIFPSLLPELTSQNLLKKTSRGWVYSGRGRVVDAVNLDGTGCETFRILCNGRLLETMDRGHAYREAHLGAIMLHQGESYVVRGMDLETHTVRVEHTDVDYYTQPQIDVKLGIIRTLATKNIGRVTCAFGDVEVTELFTGYKIKRRDTVIGAEPLSLPPLTFRTTAFWFNPPAGIEQVIAGSAGDFAGGLHGAEHAIIALMPLHVLCDRWDIGGLSSPAYGDDGDPTVFVYDAYEGGVGLAEKGYEILLDLLTTAFELVRDCRCDEGCPSCIYSPKCGNDNQPLDKKATVVILGELCQDTEKKAVRVPAQSIPAVTNESPPCSPAVNQPE